MMKILQNIVYPETSIYENDREAYIRSVDKTRLVDGRLILPAYEKVDFNTYHNFFSLKKWRLYARLQSVVLNILTSGNTQVDVVGIMDRGHYFPEQVLVSANIKSKQETVLEIPNHDKFDILYLRVQALDKPVEVIHCGFGTKDPVRQEVSLGACICTFNRQPYLKKNFDKLMPLIKKHKLDVEFFVSNNGDPLGFEVPEGVEVEKNRNLGGAGGFTRAITMALRRNKSHIVLMDDDIQLPFESLFRTVRFFEMIIPERRDVFLSGSMLSSEERWLQYERNTVLDNNGFHHQGHAQNTRDFGVALENALNDSIRGLAGWWFCAFSAKILRDYGLPMPIFVRGDDVEFSLRCAKEIVSLNGICVWHDPFINKYSEIMEDYYLPRNMIINALLMPKPMTGLINKFVLKKFWENIRKYNYAAARLNIYAVDHILRQTYKEDAESIHRWASNMLKKEKDQVQSIGFGKFYPVKRNAKSKYSRYVFLATAIGLSRGNFGTAKAGFNRNIHDFAGRKEVHIFDHLTGRIEVAKLDRKKIAQLSARMAKSYGLLMKNMAKIRKDLIEYREEATQNEFWQEIFDAEAKQK